MFSVPEKLRCGPVRRADALAGGLPRDVLEGPQFRRLHEAVYCHRDCDVTWHDRVEAARLALPEGARSTGITRLQELGLDYGPRLPLHFVVEGDLHLELEGVFLHRTVKLPAAGDDGVSVEAAFVAYCAEARTLDAIKVGCELLRLATIALDLLGQLLVEEKWRRGVAETEVVVPYLDDRCRSLPEAELLAYIRFSGMPEPEVNVTIEIEPGELITPDLWWEAYRQAVEYEGSQHQEERGQYNADLDRYQLYRRNNTAYEQVTKERMRSPKATVRRIHRALVESGYEGPAPEFEELWSLLFRRLADVVRTTGAAS